jgi:chemotaxis protein CheX
MDETILRVFTECTAGYFARVAATPAVVGTPFLHVEGADPTPSGDYTAVIGITGRRRGVVCFTAPRALLQSLLPALGETGTGDALCADLAGEIANTISGNARAELGATFMISVPVVVAAANATTAFPRDSVRYILPLSWSGYHAFLWVALQPADAHP